MLVCSSLEICCYTHRNIVKLVTLICLWYSVRDVQPVCVKAVLELVESEGALTPGGGPFQLLTLRRHYVRCARLLLV